MSLLLASLVLLGALQAQSHPISPRDLFSQETPLDMAPASFDDQYAGCTVAMTAALPDLNLTEFQTNKVYAEGWALASHQWQERRAWGPEWGPSPTRMPLRPAGALQLLSRGQTLPRCRQVFRGVHGLRFRPAGPGATVRLGGFASASLKNVAAQQFGEDTFFGIWTCLGAPIQGYSFFPGEEEVLIPPFETFQVINASRPAQGPARIYLRALGKSSTYNCEYIKGEEGTWVQEGLGQTQAPPPMVT
ncbi:GPI-linked NAD(P)(+)--arginine ADP-ribosyltransferase 1 [Tupaia chinensis]|uniref:NAD(P)(+)--arginine ADP-ribosyltransferase n=1 Tax=Tupaia chinensis TaxID=246437 RepID=L9LA40_TUPCH|nr:GPI-linked NAD(P)(+)--arginine ADP-ribosyltransferase 1 [Tupaia chinensis]